jgi:hypothetical protein
MPTESKAALVRFARTVLDILRSNEEWSADEMQLIADAAAYEGFSLAPESGDGE